MISKNLRYYRIKEKLSKDQLAELLDVKKSKIQAWESGKIVPNEKEIENISKALEISPKILLTNKSLTKYVFVGNNKDTYEKRVWLSILFGFLLLTTIITFVCTFVMKNYLVKYTSMYQMEEFKEKEKIISCVKSIHLGFSIASIVMLIASVLLLIYIILITLFKKVDFVGDDYE